jgi:hypothetical protein
MQRNVLLSYVVRLYHAGLGLRVPLSARAPFLLLGRRTPLRRRIRGAARRAIRLCGAG